VSETPLARKLRLLIEANGPMPVADYMRHCLGDPEHGYYATRDPFGAKGDFVTAPEVSQMFGEIVGAWLIEAWRLTGAPASLQLVELGPGRGTLMADILRVARHAPDFRDAFSVHLVETSPTLRRRQAETLAPLGLTPQWHGSLAEVPPGAMLLVANEFFDALPIRQFIRTQGAWRERVVGLDCDRRLAFGIGAGRLDADAPANVEDGAVIEMQLAAVALAAAIAGRIAERGGAALIIDYGYEGPAIGDTLQAVRRHQFVDPLDSPGEADLTAHVDFSGLAEAARAAGAAVHGPLTQGEFLLSLGLLERAGRLGADADKAMRETLRAAVERLAGEEQMGTLFKVLAVTSADVSPPPFAPQADV
jgi:SAM-dependent MidA family methyltransferase